MPEVKTWLLSCSYTLALTEKASFNAKLQGPASKNEEIVIPFVSAHCSNFDLKRTLITAISLVSNIKDKKLKKYLTNVK